VKDQEAGGKKKRQHGYAYSSTRFLVTMLQQIRICRTNFFDNPFRKT